MAPLRGKSSNSLLADWEEVSKPENPPPDTAHPPEVSMEFSETLAEWNEYLELHVPFFKEANYDL